MPTIAEEHDDSPPAKLGIAYQILESEKVKKPNVGEVTLIKKIKLLHVSLIGRD